MSVVDTDPAHLEHLTRGLEEDMMIAMLNVMQAAAAACAEVCAKKMVSLQKEMAAEMAAEREAMRSDGFTMHHAMTTPSAGSAPRSTPIGQDVGGGEGSLEAMFEGRVFSRQLSDQDPDATKIAEVLPEEPQLMGHRHSETAVVPKLALRYVATSSATIFDSPVASESKDSEGDNEDEPSTDVRPVRGEASVKATHAGRDPALQAGCAAAASRVLHRHYRPATAPTTSPTQSSNAKEEAVAAKQPTEAKSAAATKLQRLFFEEMQAGQDANAAAARALLRLHKDDNYVASGTALASDCIQEASRQEPQRPPQRPAETHEDDFQAWGAALVKECIRAAEAKAQGKALVSDCVQEAPQRTPQQPVAAQGDEFVVWGTALVSECIQVAEGLLEHDRHQSE